MLNKKLVSFLYYSIATTSLISCSDIAEDSDNHLKYKIVNNNLVEMYFENSLKDNVNYQVINLPTSCTIKTVDNNDSLINNAPISGQTYLSTTYGTDLQLSNYIGEVSCTDKGTHSFTYEAISDNKSYIVTPTWDNDSDTYIESNTHLYTEDVYIQGDNIVPVEENTLLFKLFKSSNSSEHTVVNYTINQYDNEESCNISTVDENGNINENSPSEGQSYILEGTNLTLSINCEGLPGDHIYSYDLSINSDEISSGMKEIDVLDYSINSSVESFEAVFNVSGDAINTTLSSTPSVVSYQLTGVDSQCVIKKTESNGEKIITTDTSGTTYIANDNSAITVNCEGETKTHNLILRTELNNLDKTTNATILVSDYALSNNVANNESIFSINGNDIKNTTDSNPTEIQYTLTGINSCKIYKLNSNGTYELTNSLTGTTYSNANNEIIKVDCNGIIGVHNINLTTTANKIEHTDNSTITINDYSTDLQVNDFKATLYVSGENINQSTQVSYELTGVDSQCVIEKTQANGEKVVTTETTGITYVSSDDSAIIVDCEGEANDHNINVKTTVNSIEKTANATINVSDHQLDSEIIGNASTFTITGNDIKNTADSNPTLVEYSLYGVDLSLCQVYKINSNGDEELADSLTGTTYVSGSNSNQIIKVDCNGSVGEYTIELTATANKIEDTKTSNLTVETYSVTSSVENYKATFDISGVDINTDTLVTYTLTGVDSNCVIEKTDENGDKVITTKISDSTYVAPNNSAITVDCTGEVNTHNIGLTTIIDDVEKSTNATISVLDYTLSHLVDNNVSVFNVSGGDIKNTDNSEPTPIEFELSGIDPNLCTISIVDQNGNYNVVNELIGTTYANGTNTVIKVDCTNQVGTNTVTLKTTANSINHTDTSTVEIKDYLLNITPDALKATVDITGESVDSKTVVNYTLIGADSCVIEKTDANGNKVITTEMNGSTYVASDNSAVIINCEGEVKTHEIVVMTTIGNLEKSENISIEVSDYRLYESERDNISTFYILDANDVKNTNDANPTPITYMLTGVDPECTVYKINANGDFEETGSLTGIAYTNSSEYTIKVDCNGVIGEHNITLETTANSITHETTSDITINDYESNSSVNAAENEITFNITSSDLGTNNRTAVSYVLTGVNEDCKIFYAKKYNGQLTQTTKLEGETYPDNNGIAIKIDCTGQSGTHNVTLETTLNGIKKVAQASLEVADYTLEGEIQDDAIAVYKVTGDEINNTDSDNATPISYEINNISIGCSPNDIFIYDSDGTQISGGMTGTTYANSNDEILHIDCRNQPGQHSISMKTTIHEITHNENSISMNLTDYTITSSVDNLKTTFSFNPTTSFEAETLVTYSMTGLDHCQVESTDINGNKVPVDLNGSNEIVNGTTYIASDNSAITVDCSGTVDTHTIDLNTNIKSIEKSNTTDVIISDYTLSSTYDDSIRTLTFNADGLDINTTDDSNSTLIDYNLTGVDPTCKVYKFNSDGTEQLVDSVTELTGTTYANGNNNVIKVICNAQEGNYTIDLTTIAHKIEHSDSKTFDVVFFTFDMLERPSTNTETYVDVTSFQTINYTGTTNPTPFNITITNVDSVDNCKIIYSDENGSENTFDLTNYSESNNTFTAYMKSNDAPQLLKFDCANSTIIGKHKISINAISLDNSTQSIENLTLETNSINRDSIKFIIPNGFDESTAENNIQGTPNGIEFEVAGNDVTFTCPNNYPYIVDSVNTVNLPSGQSLDIESSINSTEYIQLTLLGDDLDIIDYSKSSTETDPAYQNNQSIFTKVTCVKNKNDWEIK